MKMGTTGSSDKVAMNNALPDIIARIRQFTDIPLAVGFGVATRQHFETVAEAGADGVVIGSKLVNVIKNSSAGETAKNVESYCREISLKDDPSRARSPSSSRVTSPRSEGQKAFQAPLAEMVLPPRFGQFGGQYVPEALVDCLAELEQAHKAAMADPEFQKELQSHFGYINRPSQIYLAENLTKHAGGATIWLKREDLCVNRVVSSLRATLNNTICAETILAPTKSIMPSDR